MAKARQCQLCYVAAKLCIIAVLLLAGCAADVAINRLHNASADLFDEPQAVVRSDFSPGLSDDELARLKPTSPGSSVLRDALVAYAEVHDFVRAHGLPDGVRITNRGSRLDLMYLESATAYEFDLGQWYHATLTGTRALTYTESTSITPNAYWRRAANDLRVRLDENLRLLRVGRPLLRFVPIEGKPAFDAGFLVVDATPASAQLFGLPPDTHGVVVAYVDPQGPAAGKLQAGDVLTAVGNQSLAGLHDFDLEKTGDPGEPLRVTRRRGQQETSLQITPEPLAFAVNIAVWNTWSIVNAFAGGGDIVFTTGMLNFCSDDELAFVFAHELGHLAQTQDKSRDLRRAMHKGERASGIFGDHGPRKAVVRIVLAGLQRPAGNFERQEQELIADRDGFEYFAKAGYDVNVPLRFLQRLKEREDRGEAEGLQFARDHPPAAERIQQIRELIDRLQTPRPGS